MGRYLPRMNLAPHLSASIPLQPASAGNLDAVVFGAGIIGIAAARSLAAKGRRVLVIEPSGNILWEAACALENSAVSHSQSPEWDAWLEHLRARKGANAAAFDPALAEILTAHEVASGEAGFQILLYAAPVGFTCENGLLSGVSIAAKNGACTLRAAEWIDATEQGLLARMMQPILPLRVPAACYRSLVLQTRRPEKLETAAAALAARHADLSLLPSVREGERRLRWRQTEQPWHHAIAALCREIAEALNPRLPGDFAVSHCATRAYPVYAEGAAPASFALPANLRVLSPACYGRAIVTLADRFSIGSCLEAAASCTAEKDTVFGLRETRKETVSGFDVIVAGTGAAGAAAAIRAAEQGERTLALDLAPHPGGMATGGGPNGYFIGARGGIDAELDALTGELTALLAERPPRPGAWHPDAKALALLGLFERSGVHFEGNAIVTGVERDVSGNLRAVYAVLDGTPKRIPGRAFIDATGDGDLCALAGVGFQSGREGDGRTLAYSQSAVYLREEGGERIVDVSNFDSGWSDATDPWDLSAARLTAIGQYLKDEWTHPERPVAITPLTGVRHSRLMDTDYTVTLDDLIAHRHFGDSIGVANTAADTHSVDFEFESDEAAFYYLTCRSFWQPLFCELPYRMLLPRRLRNVWIAGRAAGISVEASYGLRGMLDMQRLGEAAGTAAALAVRGNRHSREIGVSDLQTILERTGTRGTLPEEANIGTEKDWMRLLDSGAPGVHLWRLFRTPSLWPQIAQQLHAENRSASFHAAAILAMWGDSAAEPRLLEALHTREDGPTPEDYPARGAWSQCIAYPFWLQAVVLLRRCGTPNALPALRDLCQHPGLPFNVYTTAARTLEKLAHKLGPRRILVEALESLPGQIRPETSCLPPSRSLWRTLHGQPQLKLGNDRGVAVVLDHAWQLHLVIARARKALGLEIQPQAHAYRLDSQGFIRRAFEALFAE